MKTSLQKAIDNNHGIYEAVFDSFGIPYKREEDNWYSLEKVPPYNSNLVTRTRALDPDDVIKEIDAVGEREGWKGWSIKDSFNILDLYPYGFRKLFDAQWLYLESTAFVPTGVNVGLTYSFAKNIVELQEWRNFWTGHNEVDGSLIYNDTILNNKDLFFVLGRNGEGEVVATCLLNKTDDVIGISNIYVPEVSVIDYWSSVIEFIQNEFESIDIVGYEREDLMQKLNVLGVKSVGDLAVWVKGDT